MLKTPSVSIIIASYNGEKYISTCLQSVLNTDYPEYNIIVIDDGSTDSSRSTIKEFVKRNKNIVYIENEVNIGLSASRNKGILLTNAEVLVFLDNDTEVTPKWIRGIIRSLYADQKIGAVQSKLVEFDDRKHIQMIGVKLIPYTGWSAPMGRGALIGEYINKVEIIGIGASFAIKRNVLDLVGFFDSKMVYFNEDLDYSWRVWIAGWKIVLASDSIVYHWTKPVSQRKNTNSTYEKIYYNMCRNSTRSLLKNYQIQSLLYYLPFYLCILIGRAFFILFTRRDTSCIRGTYKCLLWNVIYLYDTMIERKKVQKTRKVSDSYLYKKIMVNESLLQIYKKYFS